MTLQQARHALSMDISGGTRPSVFDRLAMIRFPLIVLVVCYHNESGGEFTQQLQGAPALAFAVDFLANSLGGIRVPVFFLIAGYVFFRNFHADASWFGEKLQSRARSLLLPLIAWTALWMLVLSIAQKLPVTAALLSGKSIWSTTLVELSAHRLILGFIGQGHQLFLYHLWFLRDLFVLVLLTPVIYLLIKGTRGWATLFVLVGWVSGMAISWASSDALFFFFLGCHLAIAGKSIFWADKAGLYAVLGWIMLRMMGSSLPPVGEKLWVVCGVVAILCLSAGLARVPWALDVLRRASRYSFFIFAAHEPVLTMVRRLYFAALPLHAPFDVFMAYFVIVLLTISLLVFTFKGMERVAPRVLQVMNGGRP
ncbi:MAG TPA: acyltransferase [Rhizobacter sp.]|nr:acyltransferase [Rhizobacter sp.]